MTIQHRSTYRRKDIPIPQRVCQIHPSIRAQKRELKVEGGLILERITPMRVLWAICPCCDGIGFHIAEHGFSGRDCFTCGARGKIGPWS